LLRPRPLRPGDRVAVIAPAGCFDRDSFDAGLKVLRRRYDAVFDPGIFQVQRYLAGPDARRLEELVRALGDEAVRGIFCARGGYGVMRLLPRISLETFRPKPIVGFSDITALHLALSAANWATFHGPVVTQLGRQPEHSVDRLFQLLESSEPAPPLEGATTLVSGTAEGRLLGGNLSVLTRLLGTPYLPPLQGALLVLEDVGERPYRLDRLWTHLRLAGVFEQVVGIALGDFTGCEERDASYTSAEVLRSLAQETGLPCAIGFHIGHGALNLAVPMGVRARLDATGGKLHFLEAATSE
jgi:muramoyltetrapeptide carboxypeptidase